ncbi:hypothetical protein OPV22_003564 [Ensete ventricosum]|uniref:FYR C-terminal domain-containing protein n=1 Tax=Ensete ventricosum TaxID=4639 RepID=A0AAV8S1C9_ENSVE|nr:hypothetical protein OPV22_003564 [Ensete ventricosum]
MEDGNPRGGDRDDLEITSIGALYRGQWDKKYWSASRGKDRYPYPVGYHAVRTHGGNMYRMEIHEGVKGPLFLVTSTDGDSSTGQTPDIAWENFQKKNGPRVKNQNGKRFSSKIDGVELFGFRNSFVQRLLRELLVNVYGVTEPDFLSPPVGNEALRLDDKMHIQDSLDCSDMLVYSRKHRTARKRLLSFRETKFTSRDPHLTCVDNICDADNNMLDISSNGRLRQLELPSAKVVSSSDDAALKELIKDSLPEAFSSSGSSNPNLNLADQELAKSMMTFLLPRAVPLLESACVKGKTRCWSQEVKDDQDKVGSEHFNCNMLQGEFEAGMLLSDTEENFPERLSDPIPVSGVNCQYQMRKMEQFDRSIYLDDAKHMIPDSFEDDCTVHIKKHSTMAYGIDCIASDITREKMITAKPVIAETEKVQDPSATDKVVMMAKETEKGECFLTDSLEHCLEEALNDDLFAQKENVSDASCSLGACVDHELQYLNPAFNKHDDFQNLNTGNGDVLEEMVIPEKVPHYSTCGKGKIECLEQCPPAVNSNSNLGERGTSMVVIKESSHINETPNKELQQSTSSDKLVESEIHNITDHKDCKLRDQISPVHTFPSSNSESVVNLKGDSASFFHIPNIILSTEGQLPSSFNIGKLLNPSHFSGKCNVLSESIICRNYMDDDATETYLTPRTSEMEESTKTRMICSKSNSRLFSQAHDLDTYFNANVKSSKVGDPSTLCAEKTADFMNKLHSSSRLLLPPYQECIKDVHNGSRDVLEDLTISVKNPTMRVTVDEKSNNFFHKQHKQNGHQLDGCSFESNKELGEPFELAGCYMHPEPVLSIFLSSKEDTLQISVTCGLQESNGRYLFIYTISLKDQGGNCPSFIGYTPFVLPLLTGPSTKRTAFDTSRLQFTPDSQSLVFLSSIKVPLCSVRNINCSCQTCKSDCHEENAVRVGQVNFGYVLPLAKLMTTERVSCILVCEPNYLIAAEASGTLHVWLMNCKWSGAFEEFVLPSFDHLTPAIELKMVSKSDSIIVGHNGTGGFGLWDVSRRALLATFSSPGNLIFQMLPVGIFGNKDETIFSAAQEMEHMQEILKANDWVTEDAANPLPLRQDIAVWILVSAASDLEDQVAYQLKEPNRRPDRWWRLALLLKNMVIMGSVLDPRASSAVASADYGIIGTYDGLVYKWELSTGKKLANLISLKSMGCISCMSIESKSGVLAVADDKCRLLIFKQPQGWV